MLTTEYEHLKTGFFAHFTSEGYRSFEIEKLWDCALCISSGQIPIGTFNLGEIQTVKEWLDSNEEMA